MATPEHTNAIITTRALALLEAEGAPLSVSQIIYLGNIPTLPYEALLPGATHRLVVSLVEELVEAGRLVLACYVAGYPRFALA